MFALLRIATSVLAHFLQCGPYHNRQCILIKKGLCYSYSQRSDATFLYQNSYSSLTVLEVVIRVLIDESE